MTLDFTGLNKPDGWKTCLRCGLSYKVWAWLHRILDCKVEGKT